MTEAYKVVVDKEGCPHCSGERTWTIEGPDEVCIGTSWGDQEFASDICGLMNMAYDRAEEDAPAPEAQAQQCPWAFYGTHMCRESFEAREQGLGTKKLRYPHGDPRNKPEDDPYEMSLRMNSGPERKP